MTKRNLKIFCLAIIVVYIFIRPEVAVSQYRVSGVVEFSYRDLETKVGGAVTSSQTYWTQTYQANLSGDVLDPRFLRFSAGAGYTAITYADSGVDTSSVNYNIHTSFFPNMKISWDIFGYKQNMTVESSSNIAGYDVITTSYGGTLNLRLNKKTNGRNNNNNYNRGQSFIYPDITVTRIHSESESLSPSNSLDEVRDDTRVTMTYRPGAVFDLTADGSMEEYENRATGATYDSKTANMSSNVRISADADLKITGRVTERETQNLTGFESRETLQDYNALLEFKEKEGWRHYYRYNFNDIKITTSELTTQKAEARVAYRSANGLRYHGGLDYTFSEYDKKPNPPVDPVGDKSSLEAGGIAAGVGYSKRYAPEFMGAFVLNTAYDINSGFSKLTSETGGPEGSGWYYANIVDLSINSDGWGKEGLSIGYNFNNRRDDSAVNNDIRQQSFRFSANTQRVPRTNIRGTLSYMSAVSSNEAGSIFISVPSYYQQAGLNQKRRTLIYDLSADHTVSAYLNLTAGASRGQTTTTTYTLSTLPPPTITEDELYYATANFNYPLTRRLLYRAVLREEYRTSLSAETQSHQVNMYLDYRIRSIFINLEYRWREDIPDVGQRTMQQYFFAKLSRPF